MTGLLSTLVIFSLIAMGVILMAIWDSSRKQAETKPEASFQEVKGLTYCSSCGKEVAGGDFCSHCGAALAKDAKHETSGAFPSVLWLLPVFFGLLGGVIAALIANEKYGASWSELVIGGAVVSTLEFIGYLLLFTAVFSGFLPR